MPEKLCIALFDVDGTLVNSGGAGSRSLFQALREIIPDFERPPGYFFDGKTDPIIVSELLAANDWQGEKGEGPVRQILERYTTFLNGELDASSHARVLDGVLPLLNVLEKESLCVPGLLTGNIEDGAQRKLGHFDLWNYFRVGVFGDEGKTRNELPPRALEKCRKLFSSSLEPHDLVVIGDTPKDIECGKKNGNRTIAVATGRYSLQDLQIHNPDFLFANFVNTGEVVQAILAGR